MKVCMRRNERYINMKKYLGKSPYQNICFYGYRECFPIAAKEESRKQSSGADVSNSSKINGNAEKKCVDHPLTDGKTPVDFDLEEVRRVIAGVTRGTDTSTGTSEALENRPKLCNHLSHLSRALFESYYQFIKKYYYEAMAEAEKLSSHLEGNQKKLTILKNRIDIHQRVLLKSGWTGIFFAFHKLAAKKRVP